MGSHTRPPGITQFQPLPLPPTARWPYRIRQGATRYVMSLASCGPGLFVRPCKSDCCRAPARQHAAQQHAGTSALWHSNTRHRGTLATRLPHRARRLRRARQLPDLCESALTFDPPTERQPPTIPRESREALPSAAMARGAHNTVARESCAEDASVPCRFELLVGGPWSKINPAGGCRRRWGRPPAGTDGAVAPASSARPDGRGSLGRARPYR